MWEKKHKERVVEKDVDVDTTTDTDSSKSTHEGVNGGTANRILLSPDDNHTGGDKNRPKSQVQCCTGVKCVSNCRGVHVAREPVCATGNAAVSHVLKKTSASVARYHSSTCSRGQTGDRVCKEIREHATQIVLLPPSSLLPPPSSLLPPPSSLLPPPSLPPPSSLLPPPSPTAPRHNRLSQKRWPHRVSDDDAGASWFDRTTTRRFSTTYFSWFDEHSIIQLLHVASNEVALLLDPCSKRLFRHQLRLDSAELLRRGAKHEIVNIEQELTYQVSVRIVFHEPAALQQGTTKTKTRHKTR